MISLLFLFEISMNKSALRFFIFYYPYSTLTYLLYNCLCSWIIITVPLDLVLCLLGWLSHYHANLHEPPVPNYLRSQMFPSYNLIIWPLPIDTIDDEYGCCISIKGTYYGFECLLSCLDILLMTYYRIPNLEYRIHFVNHNGFAAKL